MFSQRGARGVAFEGDRTPEALYELFRDWQSTQTHWKESHNEQDYDLAIFQQLPEE
jgi:hypothetical protein